MPYALNAAIGVLAQPNQRWASLNLSTLTVAQALGLYRRVILHVYDGTATQAADVSQWALTEAANTTLLSAFIAAQTQIAFMPTVPVINIQSAKWVNGHRANYHIQPWDALYQDSRPTADRVDALISRTDPETVPADLYKNCLVTVNGFYHLTDLVPNVGFLAYGASETLRKTKSFTFGLHSFQALGGFTLQPIRIADVFKRLSAEMIAGTVPTPGLKDVGAIHINTPLNGRQVLLVLGGYLYTPDQGVYRLVSDNTLEIDFTKLNLIDRFFESRSYINLSSLGVDTSSEYGAIPLNTLLSDAVLTKYLTLTQSFIVILNQTELYTNRHHVQKTSILGEYMSQSKPVYPLQTGLGRCPEYNVAQDGKRWSMQTTGAGHRRMLYNTTDPYGLTNITSTAYPRDPEGVSNGSLLEIGCDMTVL